MTKRATATKQLNSALSSKAVRAASAGSFVDVSKAPRISRRVKKQLGAERLDESKTRQIEEFIPKLAKNATTLAFRQALSSGNRVLIADVKGGELLEVTPDGRRRVVKQIEPSVKMQKGQIIKIK